MKKTPTRGQLLLAIEGSRELYFHLDMASNGVEGEPTRERHVSDARLELERIAKRLGMEVREREIA